MYVNWNTHCGTRLATIRCANAPNGRRRRPPGVRRPEMSSSGRRGLLRKRVWKGADDSGLVGLIYRVRDNLSFDVAIPHALTNAHPVNEIRAGLTRFIQPPRHLGVLRHATAAIRPDRSGSFRRAQTASRDMGSPSIVRASSSARRSPDECSLQSAGAMSHCDRGRQRSFSSRCEPTDLPRGEAVPLMPWYRP
jgi:hypothetical protein